MASLDLGLGKILAGLRKRIAANSTEAYAFAALCVAVAAFARWAFGLLGADFFPMAMFYPAALFAALVGGFGPGLFAAVAGGLLGWLAFTPLLSPVPTVAIIVGIATYLAAAILIVWAGALVGGLLKQVEAEQQLREVTVRELGHRLKNKVATIQSIIGFQLRGHPDLAKAISGRLSALSATDDLILAAQGRGAHVRDIASSEIAPYGASRIHMRGPEILLPPRLAIVMAMIFHELATNAAKYGALSSEAGHIALSWSVAGEKITVEWRENGGPSVAEPSHRGFGMRLLELALDQFEGSAETRFEPSGFVCKLSAVIPQNVTGPPPNDRKHNGNMLPRGA